MDSSGLFKDKLLLRLSRIGEDGWRVRTSLLAFDYSVPEAQVRKMLVQWAQEGLISLGADDGAEVRAWNEWGSTDEMFSVNVDDGHIRLKLLPVGGEYVQSIPKRFKASPR